MNKGVEFRGMGKQGFNYDDVTWTPRSIKSPEFDCLFNRLCGPTSKKHQSTHYWPFARESSGHRWIPLTKGPLCGKSFHLMTSSWILSTGQSFRSRAPTGMSIASKRRRVSEISTTSSASVGRLHALFAKMMRQTSSSGESVFDEVPETTTQDLRGMLRRKEVSCVSYINDERKNSKTLVTKLLKYQHISCKTIFVQCS